MVEVETDKFGQKCRGKVHTVPVNRPITEATIIFVALVALNGITTCSTGLAVKMREAALKVGARLRRTGMMRHLTRTSPCGQAKHMSQMLPELVVCQTVSLSETAWVATG